MRSFLLALFVVCLASGSFANLSSRYPFSAVLLNDASRGEYTLHWNFTREESIIYFAVNVSTTGWVGFGLSPNGGMVGSDVVIGWINGGASYFQDRYAEALAIPPVDSNQDWCLTSFQEDGSYTILEFNRRFVTCDDKDRDITVDTARIVWSFNPEDPQDNNDANLMRHKQRGATSINLLGGNPQQKPVASELSLSVTVSDVVIPSDSTTYWCESFKLPPAVINTTHFVNRISPVITPHAREFVHHILVYLCPVSNPLSPAEVGMSRPCDSINSTIRNCLGRGVLIGGWAVGGDEFVYPEGIAFPIGGIGEEHFVVMEMHYDNPNLRSGVVDSSGLKFFYNTEEPRHRAGIMYLGMAVTRAMMVPPRTSQYTVTAVCSANCTNQYIPDEGITIIGNLLHTHLVGRSITISHYRRDPVTNQLMELEPLDQNLNYDFNFQQFTHLRTPRVVKPGDILVMQCTYDTSTRSSITYGGESTIEEMCLSFPIFYPRPADGSALISCASITNLASADEFYQYILWNNLTTIEGLNTTNYEQTLENLNWAGDPMLASTLQNSLSNGRVYEFCLRENSTSTFGNFAVPSPDVRYQAPNVCAGVPRRELSPTCLNSDNISGSPPVAAASSLLVGLAAVLLSLISCYN